MDDENGKSPREERVVNFALLLRQYLGPEGRRYQTISQNQGIPDAEIILIVEAWLESVKAKVKQNLFAKSSFDDSGEEKS